MNEVCNKEGCDKPVEVKKRGLCRSHYQTWQRKNKPRVGTKPCTIEECEGIVYAKDLCVRHYQRLLDHGDPRWTRPTIRCSEEDCEEVAASRGMCKNHYARFYYYTRPQWGTPINTKIGPKPKDEVGYATAHYRVRRDRGHPFQYNCTECGGTASEWALSAEATDLKFAPMSGRQTASAYSLNPYDYLPMCSDCHRTYDVKHANRNNKYKGSRFDNAC